MKYTKGALIIAKERNRQIEKEGWDNDHDDDGDHDNSELAIVGALYAFPPKIRHDFHLIENYYPDTWLLEYFKASPKNRIKELRKAGALIAAEIDRLLRLRELNNS